MAAPVIEVERVSKRFGPTQALAEVDLVVASGTVLALLGPNGAGKTTLVRILTTLMAPDRGRATIAGCDVVGDAERVRPLIGLAGQYAAVDELLTGRENLELVGRLYHLNKAERRGRAQEVLERFALTHAADRLVKTYSGGMRRRLDLCASLIGRTPVVILDEPTTGLDPRARNELWQFIAELAASGTTVLLTTQYLEEADRLADVIVVIDRGIKVAEGTAAQLKAQIGGEVLEARVSTADLERASALIADLTQTPPQVDRHDGRISVPTTGGAKTLITAGRRLDDAGVALAELGLRHPSLDDVFLALTGRSAAAQLPEHDTPNVRKRSTDTRTAVPPSRPSQRSRQQAVRASSDIAAISTRNLLRFARSPRSLMTSIIDPVVLLLMFRYFLGGAIVVHGSSYVQYLLPGLFVAAVIVGGAGTAIGLTQDLKSGIVDRFRSLPIARSAVLAGRTLADQCLNLLALGVIVALGVLMGFRFHGDPGAVIVAIALIAALGYAFTWLFALIGITLKEPEASYGVATIVMFLPLLASSAFVPITTLPNWLQPVARAQPINVTINAVRALTSGRPVHHWPWQSLLWSAGILLLSATLAVRQYRKIGT